MCIRDRLNRIRSCSQIVGRAGIAMRSSDSGRKHYRACARGARIVGTCRRSTHQGAVVASAGRKGRSPGKHVGRVQRRRVAERGRIR